MHKPIKYAPHTMCGTEYIPRVILMVCMCVLFMLTLVSCCSSMPAPPPPDSSISISSVFVECSSWWWCWWLERDGRESATHRDVNSPVIWDQLITLYVCSWCICCVRVWVHVRRMVFYWILYIVCLDTHHLILRERESVLNYFFVVALTKCKSETTNVVTAYLFFL